MKKIVILLLLAPALSFAQKAKSIKAYMITAGGIAGGNAGVKPLFQLSGGVNWKNYFTGVGIGYDTYIFNSVPVFADMRFNLGDKKLVFLYAHPGYNIPGRYEQHEEYGKITDNMKGGFYMDAGFGYRLPAGKMHRFTLSTGFSHKRMVRAKAYSYPCGFPGCNQTDDVYSYHYNYGRIVTKLAWEIGRE